MSDRRLHGDRSAPAARRPVRRKPVAITVILTLPFSAGSTTAPKMMLASSSRRLLDDRRRLADFDQRQVRAAGDVDDHAARAVDRRAFEQRARDRAPRRFDRAVLAFGDAGAHHRQPHAGHDRLHVGEVEVDRARAPGSDPRCPESPAAARRRPWRTRRSAASSRSMIVSSRSFGNRDDRVDAVAQRLEAALGLQLPLPALELERLGDDARPSARRARWRGWRSPARRRCRCRRRARS